MSVATDRNTVDHAPLLERIFELEPAESSYPVEGIEGEVPGYLRGTYYVNGPGRFGRGDLRYRHWLDGDGMVASLTFDRSGVHFRNRFVRSAKYTAEEEAGEALFRTFGTGFDGDRLKRGIGLESPVNVSVYRWRGELLAFGEQGLPWLLDAETLETRGEHTFGRRLNAVSPFSAHPCFDPVSGEMFNFGVSFAAQHPCVHLYRFGADGELVYRRRVPLDRPSSMHDFGLSESYCIFHRSPYDLDVRRMMTEGETVMEALRWHPEDGTRLVVAAREDGERLASIPIGDRYCLHLVNCFEEGGRLVVDLVELDRPIYDQYQVIPDLFTDAPRGRPVRRVIDPASWTVAETAEMAYDPAPDFPAIDPRRTTRPYRHFWMLGISHTGNPGRKFFDQLAHLDWQRPSEADVYQAPEGCYLGCEPIFLPDPDDDGRGVVICKRFDAGKVADAFLLFDPHDVARGPIATLPLREATPPGFHASWSPATP